MDGFIISSIVLFGLPSVADKCFNSLISDTNISTGTFANFDKIKIISGVKST